PVTRPASAEAATNWLSGAGRSGPLAMTAAIVAAATAGGGLTPVSSPATNSVAVPPRRVSARTRPPAPSVAANVAKPPIAPLPILSTADSARKTASPALGPLAIMPIVIVVPQRKWQAAQ